MLLAYAVFGVTRAYATSNLSHPTWLRGAELVVSHFGPDANDQEPRTYVEPTLQFGPMCFRLTADDWS